MCLARERERTFSSCYSCSFHKHSDDCEALIRNFLINGILLSELFKIELKMPCKTNLYVYTVESGRKNYDTVGLSQSHRERKRESCDFYRISMSCSFGCSLSADTQLGDLPIYHC